LRRRLKPAPQQKHGLRRWLEGQLDPNLRFISLIKDKLMSFTKSSGTSGKQASMPGPRSAAYKKIVAARKTAKSSKGKAHKRARSTAAFSSLKSRQMLVERLKREIWASVLKINDAVINLALAGNFNAAKALFDFAGVYSLPEPDDDANPVATSAEVTSEQPTTGAVVDDPVDAFFRSIGVGPSTAEPEPEPEATR
jgi:hypothetical protein